MATGLGGEIVWICPTLSFVHGVNDLSGNGNHGTLNGASILYNLSNGGDHAMEFQDEDHRVEIGRPAQVIASPNDFSISAWIYQTTTGDARTIWGGYSDLGSSKLWSLLRVDGGNLKYWYANASGNFVSKTGPSVSSHLNSWVHIAITIDSSNNIKFFVNGSQSGSTQTLVTPSSAPHADVQFWIGQSQSGLAESFVENFDGQIDDFRWFDRAITDYEVSKLARRRGYVPTNGIGDEVFWLCPSINDSANDISGNDNHGTYAGGMGTISDTTSGGSRCYDFDGSNDHISIPAMGSFENWSVSVWSYFDALGSRRMILTNDKGGWNDDVLIGISPENLSNHTPNNTVTAIHQDNNAQTRTFGNASSPSSTGTWYHLVWTADGNNLNCYVDGALDSSTPRAGADLTFANQNVYLGNDPENSGVRKLDGRLDDIRFFGRALTASEVTSLASTRGFTSDGGSGGEGEPPPVNRIYHPFTSFHVIDA